jgi:hypothetical protein
MRFTGRHSMDGIVSAAPDSYVPCVRMVWKTTFDLIGPSGTIRIDI